MSETTKNGEASSDISQWLENELANSSGDASKRNVASSSSMPVRSPASDVSSWLEKELQAPGQQEEEKDDESGDDEYDEMAKWMMETIKEESNPGEIPVGAPHVSDEEWKIYEIDVKTDSLPPISKSGWLQKRGRANNSYKRRFCELRGNVLYYYHSEKKNEGKGEDKRGEINLLRAEIQAEREEKGDRMVRKKDFLHYIDAEAARKRGVWIEGEEVRKCMNHTCQRKFGLHWRRHHCRYCGRVFCSECITTGRGRKLINQPSRVEKQGYEGVKICHQCAVLPATRMTEKLENSSQKKTSTLPSRRKVVQSNDDINQGGALDSSFEDSTKYNSAPIERSSDKPAQLPASFLEELQKPIAGTSDLLETPTIETDTPAQLPSEWMERLSTQGLSSENEKMKASPKSSTENATADGNSNLANISRSLDSKETPANDYEARKANSIKRRKNRAYRQTYTKISTKQLDVVFADKTKQDEEKKSKIQANADEGEDDGPPIEQISSVQDEQGLQKGGIPENTPRSKWDTVIFSVHPQGLTRRYKFQAESPEICKEWVRVLLLHSKKHAKSILKKQPGEQEIEPGRTTRSGLGSFIGKKSQAEIKLEPNIRDKHLRFASKNHYYDGGGKGIRSKATKDGFVRTGYLAKVGMQIRTWHVRFFALRGNMLTYFRISGDTKQQRGTIWLRGAEVCKVDNAPVGWRGAKEDTDDDATPTLTPTSENNNSRLSGFHSRNPTKHIVANFRNSQDFGASPNGDAKNARRRSSIHARQISADSLEPNVRKEKTRYVYEFLIKTRQQPKAKHGNEVHISKLKKGRKYHVRASSRRDRREWIKAIKFAASQ